MTTTPVNEQSGTELAKAMQINTIYAEQLSGDVNQFNADASKHGEAWDKSFTDRDALLNEAENLEFADFKKKLNAITSTRLRLMQARVAMFTRRQQLLDGIEDELSERIESCQQAMDTVRSTTEEGLRAAGKGPEDSILGARGAINQATIEFNKEVESTQAFHQAQRAFRQAKTLRINVRKEEDWSSEVEVRDELRKFVSGMMGM